MASAGLGDHPLLNDRVTRESLAEPIAFANVSTASSDAINDYFFGAAAAPTYTLTADAGIYALTGIAAGLRVARKITADQGALALSGQAAGLRYHRLLTAAAGSYTLSGQTVDLRRALVIAAVHGTYALSGQAVDLRYARIMIAAQGSYALSGQDVELTAFSGGDRSITAENGSYALSGQSVNLLRHYRLVSDGGSYALSGQAAGFSRALRLAAGTGNYSIIGQRVSLNGDEDDDESASNQVSLLHLGVLQMITTTTDSFTRPANTTAYTAADLVANSATAGSVEPLTFTTTQLGSGRGIVRRVRLYKDEATTTAATFTIHLFSRAPTVTNGDNGAFAVNTARYYLGGVAVDMSSGAFVVGSTDIIKTASASPEINFDLASVNAPGERRLYGLIEVTGGYAPASAELFEVTLEIAGSD